VAAGIYLARLCARYPALEATHLNVHRLVITGVVVAIKFFDDKYYSNGFYAKVGGVSRAELNLLELELLQLLDFNAYVGAEDVQKYLSSLSSLSSLASPAAGCLPAFYPGCVSGGVGVSRPSSAMASDDNMSDDTNYEGGSQAGGPGPVEMDAATSVQIAVLGPLNVIGGGCLDASFSGHWAGDLTHTSQHAGI
jgi:hypothetical protein